MEFKFAIGQFVRPRGVELSKKLWEATRTEEQKKDDHWALTRKDSGPVVLQVIERTATECPGGVQHNYSVRLSSRDGYTNDFVRFNEIELEAIPPNE